MDKLLILFTLFLFTSCSLFERRDFMNEMEYQYDEPLFQANRDFMVVPGDTGRAGRTPDEISTRTPATFEDQEQFRYQTSLQRELGHLENRLTDEEYSDYQQYKAKLGGTSEKIYFLRLSAADREAYLRAKNIKSAPARSTMSASRSGMYRQNLAVSAPVQSFPKINDVALGMSKDDVLQNWGQPERRDVAGNPEYENERWAYRKNGTVKYIYFEAGRVEGWEEY